MRTTTHEKIRLVAERTQRDVQAGMRDGLTFQTVDAVGDDGTLVIDGARLVNFGSCSYLGLWEREELKQAAIAGIERFGVSYSSSRLYSSLSYYEELEAKLGQIFHARAVVTGTTTLGHLSALPAVVEPGDALVIDRQAHSSLGLTSQVLAARGIPIHPVPHSDLDVLDATIERLAPDHGRVWYVADGVYSMFGDIAPNAAVLDMLDRHPTMHAYIDDAHGFAWAGVHGRGVALQDRAMHPRLILAISLSKAFGAGGGAIVAGDPVLADQIALRGGPLMFGGPVQTAELAAGVAAADLLLSPGHVDLRQRIDAQIAFVTEQALANEIGMTSWDPTPIWFVEVGEFDTARRVARRMLDHGFWVNISSFPVVPQGRAGIRFTHTLSQTHEQIAEMLAALGTALRELRAPELVIDLARTTDQVVVLPA